MKKFKLIRHKFDTGLKWSEINLDFKISYFRNLFRFESLFTFALEPEKIFHAKIKIGREKYKHPNDYLSNEIFYEMIEWCEHNAEYVFLRMHRLAGWDFLDDYDVYHYVKFSFYKEDYLKFLLKFS